jgi:hypothetical protein
MIYENMEVSGSLRAAQIIAGPKKILSMKD